MSEPLAPHPGRGGVSCCVPLFVLGGAFAGAAVGAVRSGWLGSLAGAGIGLIAAIGVLALTALFGNLKAR